MYYVVEHLIVQACHHHMRPNSCVSNFIECISLIPNFSKALTPYKRNAQACQQGQDGRHGALSLQIEYHPYLQSYLRKELSKGFYDRVTHWIFIFSLLNKIEQNTLFYYFVLFYSTNQLFYLYIVFTISGTKNHFCLLVMVYPAVHIS